MPTQNVEASALEFQLSASEFVDAIIPTLLSNSGFLTKLANNVTFVTALSASSAFKRCVTTLAGSVAGGIVTQGLGR